MTISVWMLKAIVQKAISWLPYSQQINFLFQKHITKGVRLSDDYFIDRLQHAQNHVKGYQTYMGGNMKSTLELGTGWYPVVPLAMFLSGADEIYTLDISPLMNKENIITTLQKYLQYDQNHRLSEYIQPQPERLAQLKTISEQASQLSFEQLLEQLHLKYLLADARQLPLPNHSIDLIHSNNTFEHIYPHLLRPILSEFKRVAKPKSLQSHAIDMSDHFAHLDKKITIYNFLKFSDQQWAWIDNDIQPQSRLRYSDYLRLYADLQIPITHANYTQGNVADVKSIDTAPQYQQYDPQDLAISHCHIYSVQS